MTVQEKMRLLFEAWGRLSDLGRARAILEWDQETMMPPAGTPHRAQVLATLSGLAHEKLTSPELGEILAFLEERKKELDPLEAAHLREASRAREQAVKIPRDLVERQARATSLGLEAWKEARSKSDYALFLPHLQEILELKREESRCLGGGGEKDLYDPLLDQYEPGMTAKRLEDLFGGLQGPLAELAGKVRESGRRVDLSPFQGDLDPEAQLAFGRKVLEAMGFDLRAGRIDKATHPFCSGHGPGDVRITWRFDRGDLRPALFGLVHEAGHGLYEQGLDPALDRTPAGPAASLGVHESQSRLWENLVARSLPFWEGFAPLLEEVLPGRKGPAHPEALFRAAGEVKPSLIRVEADEVTYNLHILLRFRLERKLLSGELPAAEAPAAWNELSEELIGVRPERDADGILQDIHWAMGAVGYFPTYTLGNIYAAHLFEAARRDIPGLEEGFKKRELLPLREWLKEKIHRHGSVLPPERLVTEAAGAPPTPQALLRHLEQKVSAVYGV